MSARDGGSVRGGVRREWERESKQVGRVLSAPCNKVRARLGVSDGGKEPGKRWSGMQHVKMKVPELHLKQRLQIIPFTEDRIKLERQLLDSEIINMQKKHISGWN